MKLLDKIALAFFSVIMFVISLVYILLHVNYISIDAVTWWINLLITEEPNKTVFLVIAGISLLLSIKVIISSLFCSDIVKDPIKIDGENGVLEIMPDTIENISKIIVSNYVAVSEVNTRMESKKDGIIVKVNCTVIPEINITELVSDIQSKIKERVERQTSATVLKVNVKVKDVKKAKEE